MMRFNPDEWQECVALPGAQLQPKHAKTDEVEYMQYVWWYGMAVRILPLIRMPMPLMCAAVHAIEQQDIEIPMRVPRIIAGLRSCGRVGATQRQRAADQQQQVAAAGSDATLLLSDATCC
jgi:hypothetical protein